MLFFKLLGSIRKLKYLAFHDSLTGLVNRNWLNENIGKISFKYIYFIDINDLHKINKEGHTFGDEYIKDVVKSIELVEGEILLRYAGDEFILFSNRLNAIDTNLVVSVGFCEVNGSVLEAIHHADTDMLASKRIWKGQM